MGPLPAALLLLLAQPSTPIPGEGELPWESPFDIPAPLFPAALDSTSCGLVKRAERLDGPPIQYTPEALAARVQGTMIVKCIITREGRVRDCKVLKGLDHMNEAAVKALEASRYKPMEFQGQPVETAYTFTLRFTLPRDAAQPPDASPSTGTGPRQKRRNDVR